MPNRNCFYRSFYRFDTRCLSLPISCFAMAEFAIAVAVATTVSALTNAISNLFNTIKSNMRRTRIQEAELLSQMERWNLMRKRLHSSIKNAEKLRQFHEVQNCQQQMEEKLKELETFLLEALEANRTKKKGWKPTGHEIAEINPKVRTLLNELDKLTENLSKLFDQHFPPPETRLKRSRDSPPKPESSQKKMKK